MRQDNRYAAGQKQQTVTARFNEALTAINARLEVKPKRVIAVVPGASIVWDDCDCGQLTARLAQLAPVLVQPGSMPNCGIQYWRATGEITLLRCALTINDQGVAPAPHQLLAEGSSALDDSDVILSTLASLEWVTAITTWLPQGPIAGCRGIQVNFTFNLDHPPLIEVS